MKISFIDMWSEKGGVPLYNIDNILEYNPTNIPQKITEGVGLLHKNYLCKFFNDIVIVNDPTEADVLIFSIFGNKHINYNKSKLFIGYEARAKKNINSGFPTISSFDSSKTNFYLPLYTFYFGFGIYNEINNIKKINVPKKFAICIISNTNCLYRNNFVKRLMEYKHIDCYGKLYKNTYDLIIETTSWYDPRLIDKISEYKFMICMENEKLKGYHTEKIVLAYKAGVIPIYWGDPNIKNIFYSNTFIDIIDIERTIRMIKTIDEDDELYLAMINTHKCIQSVSEESYLQFLNNIFYKS